MLVALILLVRTNLAEQQLRWRDESIYFSQDITLDFLRDGFIYSVLVLALAWITQPGRSVQVHSLLDQINQRFEQTSQQVNKLYGGLTRQKTIWRLHLWSLTLSGGTAQCWQQSCFHSRCAGWPLLAGGCV